MMNGASNAKPPKVTWPDKFSMKLITDTYVYNTTIGMKFDSFKNKIWAQVNYTSPIFGGFEAFQLALLPNAKNVSLKIDDECKWAYVYDISYIYLSLIFNSWSYYTNYMGLNAEGLHEFHLIDYIQSQKVGNVTFLFEEAPDKSRVELVQIGVVNPKYKTPLMLKVIELVTERPDMKDEDFQFGKVK
eukprot:CAMPEP_0168336426 /NCGR_PEP_ID=MMETSP0213-20121227/11534_1 /TAXON_ID=151035 /ORGANISM="Euplotes harpa, Strain FSP1.4" /LENGTH=186 /DNA_ID=CAMNT_0008341615 /DNA_START=108 /DNA_END=668 /DNA_ORIENTATION=-